VEELHDRQAQALLVHVASLGGEQAPADVGCVTRRGEEADHAFAAEHGRGGELVLWSIVALWAAGLVVNRVFDAGSAGLWTAAAICIPAYAALAIVHHRRRVAEAAAATEDGSGT